MSEFTRDPSNEGGNIRPTRNKSGLGGGTDKLPDVNNSDKLGQQNSSSGAFVAGRSRGDLDPVSSANTGGQIPGTSGNTGHEGGTGYTGGSGTGGTGYTGGGGTGNGGVNGPRAPREPKSTAAVWIVGIVVVVGALAIWIARNTVDDTDTMQARPGIEQRDADRGTVDRNSATIGTDSDRNFENRRGEQGSYGTDVGTGSGASTDDDRGVLQGQQGTGTIQGDSEDRRFDGQEDGTTGNSVGAQSGGTGTTGASGTGTTDDHGTVGTGTAPEGTGSGTSTTGTGQGVQGTGSQGVGTGSGTGTTTTP